VQGNQIDRSSDAIRINDNPFLPIMTMS